MAGRDPWTMRNGGILGGLFPDDGQDLAFRDLAPLGEPAWAQAARDLMARSAQGSAAARDYPIPSQPAPWFPSAPSVTNTWLAQPQRTTGAYPSQAQGPSWLENRSGNPPPPPLLHELPYFASEPTLPLPWVTPMPNSQALGSDNRLSPEASASSASSEKVVPVGFRTPTIPWLGPMPWPTPTPSPTPPTMPPFEEWLNNANKGLEGLFSYFRSRSGSWGGGNDESECDRRHQEEVRKCAERRPLMAHDDYYDGCLARAQQRWLGCLKNGGKPPRREVPEWEMTTRKRG
jgi:hypothetical protein